MALARTKVAAKPLPPCAVCGKPAPHAFWDTHLCDRCVGRWLAEAPPLQALEECHAAEHLEDVEARGFYRFVKPGAEWVILKPGTTERVAKAAALAWVQRSKARAA